MRSSRASASGGWNESVRRGAPAHRAARGASRFAVDLGYRAELDAASPAQTCGVRKASRLGRVIECLAVGDPEGSGLCPFRPAARSASPAHCASRPSHYLACPRTCPDLALTSDDDGNDDKQQPSVPRVSSQLGRTFRSGADTSDGEVDLLLYLYQTRSAWSTTAVGSDREDGGTPKEEGGQPFKRSSLRRNLLGGVGGVERPPERPPSRTTIRPRPAAFQVHPQGTAIPLTVEPAGRRSRAGRRPRIREVYRVGRDRMQDVDGLGDLAVYGAPRRRLAP